jgi:L-alanine-DL-glutamate epimerase-like enolase superfamily enzyme
MISPQRAFEAKDIVRASASPLLAAADPDTLKIRRVEAHVLRIGRRSETAEGIHGWVKARRLRTVQPVVAQIRSLVQLLVGASAWDIEKLWRRMYILEESTLGGTLFAAMSAVDIA